LHHPLAAFTLRLLARQQSPAKPLNQVVVTSSKPLPAATRALHMPFQVFGS
jgi:hypothetical protein